MKLSIVKQICTVLVSIIAISSIVNVTAHTLRFDYPENAYESIQYSVSCTTPCITENGESTVLLGYENASWLLIPGNPKIPMMTKVFTFPLGTEIVNVTCRPGSVSTIAVQNPLSFVPAFQSISGDKTLGKTTKNPHVYESGNAYPSTWYDVSIGGGLSTENVHVTILTIHTYPVRYAPMKNCLTTVASFDITVTYELPHHQIFTQNNDTYDLTIITPPQYASGLTVLKDHKDRNGIKTLIKTIEDIYSEYNGRDKPEKIKKFIKEAVETYGIHYVLLIGDITQLPIRSANSYPWDGYHGNGMLSDLYYADLYDGTGAFCSWDANENNMYGEVTSGGFPPLSEDNIDQVDLYPDVHIGRIPCSTPEELMIMMNKIITYEQFTYDQTWFHKIILVGGDTFPLSKGSPINVFEGEITNVKVSQQLPGFNKLYLWSSKHNLNAHKFNQAVSQGAGFLSYAGHGFEHGWGTYRPNAIIDGNLIIYYSPFIKQIDNEQRLPLVFFDACLTAKFDFNISDLIGYYGLKARFVNVLLGRYTADDYFPPFAWCFIKHENGGGIAAVGATRPAYTYVDKDGVYAGAGYLDVHFFKAYEEGITAGEMLTLAQNDYLNYVGFDAFTIEEYELLGDPSLRVGGYP